MTIRHLRTFVIVFQKESITTVSYTHLDVYKRQGLGTSHTTNWKFKITMRQKRL